MHAMKLRVEGNTQSPDNNKNLTFTQGGMCLF